MTPERAARMERRWCEFIIGLSATAVMLASWVGMWLWAGLNVAVLAITAGFSWPQANRAVRDAEARDRACRNTHPARGHGGPG